MSPEWLWSGHGVCSFGTLELWGASKVPKFQNCTLCPQSGYGQGMGSAVLELWNFGGASKVPKFQNCTLCLQSGYGQGMGSAVLELWNFGGPGPPKFESCSFQEHLNLIFTHFYLLELFTMLEK